MVRRLEAVAGIVAFAALTAVIGAWVTGRLDPSSPGAKAIRLIRGPGS